ncbi:cadherin-like beta sandwich domain-containing protein [Neobacillus pocheonensis]|uniref:cadherin-like beta sandwich domain-containing protein n=1 Tax=Neobacillus pocheonensis TaxID=363869 RepID=UPI003D29DFE4
MLKRLQKRGMNAILIISIAGMGTVSYTPAASAESVANVETNLLSNLEIKGISLDKDFSADNFNYSASISNDVQEVTLHVESENPESVISINGKVLTTGNDVTYALQTGVNTFLITVNDGTHTTSTYTLTVTREQNNNNLLQNIKLSAGELSPSFSSKVTDYSVEVSNDTSAITVTPSAIEKTSTISVNGDLLMESSATVELPVGKKDIQIIVTAESGEKRIYTLHVTRAKAASIQVATIPSQNNRNSSFQPTTGQISTNTGAVQKTTKARLTSLSVSTGTWDSTFTSDEYTYHIAVANDVKTVTINPIAAYSSSSIKIEGTTNKTVQLENDNKTIISVVVTYDDDDHKTYVLVFDKEK